MNFSRLLMYARTSLDKETHPDYGQVTQVITDKLINVNMSGSDYTLEAVGLESGYVPKIGDWVVVNWANGNPTAKGTSSSGYGLTDINAPTVVSTNDLASGTINSDHIRTNTIEARHLQADSVTATAISANSITAQAISANAVTSQAISANSIQTQHISANSISGGQIMAGTIDTVNIKSGAITSNLISANSITSTMIQASSILSYMISANQIQTQHISANSIMSYQIGANQVNANNISANSISAPMIQANAVTTNAISANSITSALIQSNAIQTQHISANTINTSMIQANSITSSLISSNSISATHLQASSVTSQSISANAIQTQHISANTITTNMIKAGAITTSLISANSIVSSLIQAGAINSTHITANAIQSNMIGANQIMSQHISANQINSTHISANSILSSMISSNQVLANHISSNQVNATHISANSVTSTAISANAVQTQHISANSVQASQISANAVQTQHISANTIVGSQIKSNQISANHIVANSITAQQMQVGTITAQSGILASGSIGTANIQDGVITSAKIGNGEIKTANIASGNITNALIANATIDHTKIGSVDASTITVGQLNGSIITAGTISGNAIQAGTITGDRLVAGSIDSTQIKAGAIITNKIAAGAITSTQIQAGAVTSDAIRAGSITAEHISTVGLDAQLMSVYNSATGETLIGGGYLRVDGLDAGVVQSDNLMKNGLFLASSTNYGYIRMNPTGEALLGNTQTGVGSHQIWKIDLVSGGVVKTIDIPSKKPFDVVVHPSGNYAYVTVQGDNTLAQIDLMQDMLTNNTLPMGIGPARAKYTGIQLHDMKHIFVLNTDTNNAFTPDSLTVIDTPPESVNSDLYVHHDIPLGTNPYDFIIDSNAQTWITLAGAGEVVMVDTSSMDSHTWKVKGRIPITAYGTDLLHGGLDGTFGLQEVTGGDASGQYNATMSSQMNMTMSDSASGYGSSDGSLRTYAPHGIEQSSDANTLYVVDSANGELVVVDKLGSAPYDALNGSSPPGSYATGNTMNMSGSTSGMSGMSGTGVGAGPSPAQEKDGGEISGGGPGTYYVRYRIPVGDSPEYVTLVNGKLFITLSGSNSIAVIDESAILTQINDDRSFYGTYNGDGTWQNWNVMQPMRTVTLPTARMVMNVGTNPTHMKVLGNNIYVSLSNQGQIAVVDTNMEMVTKTINVGTNPQGFDFTPDGRYMYVANFGGIDNLSFIYPQGTYIGDPYLALEGGINYQGADGWSPDRSNWIYDVSGNIQSKSVVEFHINEPFLNEGGYAKLQSFGIDSQYAKIEQDITNVTNYSNGNNVVNVIQGTLNPDFSGNIWSPKEGAWVNNPPVKNINICSLVSGNIVKTTASANTYTINYGTWGNGNSNITFNNGTVPSGNWIEADYTAPNNIYFATQNSSIEVAIDNGSSPNFAVSYQVDEYVPKFVVVDNQQTSSFTPTADGISDTYTGLQYSTMTNQAYLIPSGNIASNCALSSGNIVVDGDTTSSKYASGSSVSGGAYVKLDLGATYMIGQINVWHYYADGRTYHNTKTEVSEDGTHWTTVFDSAVSGEYAETSSGHTITFNALPVRYVRDWTNGSTSNTSNHWVEIQAMGDWLCENQYKYPSNSPKAGQQIATNGKYIVTTDVSNAWVAMDIQIEFTSWWYMTYVVGPQFGKLKVDMPSMGMSHFLTLTAPFVNNVAHRHIMSFPPSALVEADSMRNIKAGKHRVVISQVSGKISIDRFRFEDFQYYNRSTLSIPTSTSATLFTRYKVIAEQAQWYVGQGRQTTEGAYDAPRTNPDSGLQDYSVPLKYRVRLLAELSPSGNVQEQGTVYATSAIFEKGKLSSHWRRSESADVVPAHQIETWNSQQPFTTGIQKSHIANGAIDATKILVDSIMDWNISNYARIQEHKLQLNYPTHQHGWYTVEQGAGPMGSDLMIWNDNLSILDTIQGWAGTSGNYGTGNTMARGDHNHDDRYLLANGGSVTGSTTFSKGIISQYESHFSNGTYSDPAVNQSFGIKVSQGIATDKINVNGNITVTGNIVITGTVDGADISVMSGNLYSHIGSGGSAHAVAVSGGANGFIDGGNYGKLLRIQDNAINQSTADGRYLQLTGGNISNTLNTKAIYTSGNVSVTGNITVTGTVDGVDISVLSGNVNTLSGNIATVSGNLNTTNSNLSALSGNIATVSGNLNTTNNNISILSGNIATISGNLNTTNSNVSALSGNIVTISGNLNTTNSNVSTISGNLYSHIGSGGSAHAVAVSGGSNGFIDGQNYGKLLRIQDNAINQSTADSRYLQLTGGTLSSDLTLNGQLIINNYNAGIQFKSSAFDSNGYQWWHGPNGSGDNILLIVRNSTGNSNYSWKINGTDTVWTSSNLGSDPATRTWISGNYYNSSTIDTKLSSKGDVFQVNSNTFTNLNTFTNAGMGIKIQPSGSVPNTTKLMQINNTSGAELFSVNYSGGVVVAGDLVVTGQTKYAGTTSVNGDYNISGNLYVSGNSTLGNVNTDTTTVNGTLVVNGNIQEVGNYQEVHRRPIFGIAGDLQFQTNSTTFDKVVDFYNLSGYAIPTVQTGATRYYRLYMIYSDDINTTQVSGGQQASVLISGSTTKSFTLPYTWGDPNARRDWYSSYFTDLPTGNGNLYAMLSQSGNNLGIRWVELIAYDKF